MNTFETILSIITAISGGGILGVFLERRKRKAETKILEADALSKMQEQYKVFVEDTQKKYEELHKENEFLRQKIKELEEKLKQLKSK